MTFFNKKTDVIDIELTPYGRYLLSIGKLKPVFYEFVDDDVLYDIAAAGLTEDQTEAHDRITKDTPKLKTLYLKRGIDDDSGENYRSQDPNDVTPDKINVNIDNIREQEEYMTHQQKGVYAMGRSSLTTEKLPNFQITMLRGQIKDSASQITSSVTDALQIPQIDVNLVVTATLEEEIIDPSANYEFVSNILSDGTYVKLSFDQPIIHLKEFNSFYEKENFEIEVFSVEQQTLNNGETIEKLFPLKFLREQNLIQNGLLLDAPVTPMSDNNPTDDYVDYFFSFDFDEQIPIEELCEVINDLEINSQFLDEELICPDQRTERFDIYSTRVEPSDLEDCD